VKATKQLQEKLEALMKAIHFKVRYEKGSFKSGYCIIEEQNVAVINKFFPMESKVAALVEILRSIEVDEAALDEASRKLLHKVRQTEITL
jgi:predicted nuclease with TOPRIM domain